MIDSAKLAPMWFASSTPKPNRVMLFSIAEPVHARDLPPFAPDAETAERGIVYGPAGLDEVFAFSLHVLAAKKFFADRGVTGPHAFAQR